MAGTFASFSTLLREVLPQAPEVKAYHAVYPKSRSVVFVAAKFRWQAYELPRPESLFVQDRVV
jgi:hypothetical protein